ncbi:Acyl carrier protein-like protein, partial [Cynara cardunculus var. scolymus]
MKEEDDVVKVEERTGTTEESRMRRTLERARTTEESRMRRAREREGRSQMCLLLERSSLGQNTYFPEAVLQVPPNPSMAEARKEAEMVMFGAIDELLAKTGVKAKDIGILIFHYGVVAGEHLLKDQIESVQKQEEKPKAKPEIVDKVCSIVRKQLALPEDSAVTGESKFSSRGADSLDTEHFLKCHGQEDMERVKGMKPTDSNVTDDAWHILCDYWSSEKFH